MDTKDIIKLRLKPVYQIFYNNKDFGIYRCEVVALYTEHKVRKVEVIKGTTAKLELETEYDVAATRINVKGYGDELNIISIKQHIVKSKNGYKEFLSQVISPKDAETLLSVYPDIVDMIISGRADEVDLSKTKGIKEIKFGRIVRRVEENIQLADLIEKYHYVFSFKMLKKLYDEYGSVDVIESEIKAHPYKCLYSLDGVGFIKADEYLLKLEEFSNELIAQGKEPLIYTEEPLRVSIDRMTAAAKFALEELQGEGHTCIDIGNFRTRCQNVVPEAMNHFDEVVNNRNMFIRFGEANQLIALKVTYDYEREVWETASAAIRTPPIPWSINVEDYRTLQLNDGTYAELTDRQLSLLKTVADNSLSILCGYAGTGKSSTVQALINMLAANDLTYMMMAPTGRAAKVLSKYTEQNGVGASTIHRGLGYEPPSNWRYNDENPVDVDVVIVDEFSMADVWLAYRLFQAVDFNRTRILLVGDDAQLQSVGCGCVLRDFINWRAIPTVFLDEVFRYKSGSLSRIATDIRNNRCPYKFAKDSLNISKGCRLDIDNNNVFLYRNMNHPDLMKTLLNTYRDLIQKYPDEETLILSPYNKGEFGTVEINRMIQNYLYGNTNADFLEYGYSKYYEGEPVIQCKNDYKALLYPLDEEDEGNRYVALSPYDAEDCDKIFIPNGEVGRIIKIFPDIPAMVVRYDNTDVYICDDKFDCIKLAYAISVHKSQGGQAENVITVVSQQHSFMLDSSLLYVAATRASKRICFIGDTNAFERSIFRSNRTRRMTALGLWAYNANQKLSQTAI